MKTPKLVKKPMMNAFMFGIVADTTDQVSVASCAKMIKIVPKSRRAFARITTRNMIMLHLEAVSADYEL